LTPNQETSPPESVGRSPLPGKRRALFLALTLLAPLIFFGAVEGVARLLTPDGGLPLFTRARFVDGDYLVASRSVGARWFAGIDNPPAPPPEMFAARKPDRSFRVFVLGESAAAGFPYPRNGTFSRYLRDMLRDALPQDSVEVINLAIAATNSFAMLDIADEIAAQSPDAVLVYAGHNEYYGALGAASRVEVPGGTPAVRLYLRLLRLRSVLALRNAIASVRRSDGGETDSLEAASLMEVLGRDREVPLHSSRYHRGARQFESNLESIIRAFTKRGMPVLIASIPSNLRDQRPFAADANSRSGGSVTAFEAARLAISKGDSTSAERLFSRARDLDVVRFRAPSEFDAIIRRVGAAAGAIYVPVAEAFADASPAKTPGNNLFLEHVHPNRDGQAMIARVFFKTMLEKGVLGSPDTTRLRTPDEYLRGMTLTPFDERVAFHTVRTLISRWPFVPERQQEDYRLRYSPTGLLDSMAFAASRGARWEIAKLRLAADYEQRRQFDSAAAEYAGLVRDAPLVAEPLRLMARALSAGNREGEAEAALRRAVAIQPSAADYAALGALTARRRDVTGTIAMLQQSLALQPRQPKVLYQLSLAYGISRDLPNARAAAMRLRDIAPAYPGLDELLRSLGVSL